MLLLARTRDSGSRTGLQTPRHVYQLLYGGRLQCPGQPSEGCTRKPLEQVCPELAKEMGSNVWGAPAGIAT